MYTTKIINVETAYSNADSNYFIDVELEVYKDGELVGTRRFGYPMGTTKDEILTELEKLCVTLASDEENSARSAELDKQLTAAESLKKELMPENL